MFPFNEELTFNRGLRNILSLQYDGFKVKNCNFADSIQEKR